MDIQQERIDDLNTVLRVKLSPTDYAEKVDKRINEYRKKIKMPGFRAGHVPSGHVKKLYGKSILVEEINQLLSSSIDGYIKKNELHVLGQPLPLADSEAANNWELGEEFNFAYEMGLAPTLEVAVSEKDKINKYQIKIDDKTFNERILNIRRSYGGFKETDEVHDEDVLSVEFKQLDANGNFLEEGIQHSGNLRLEQIKDKKYLKEFIGKKKGDLLIMNLFKAVGKDNQKLAALLHINEEKAQSAKGDFQILVNKIFAIEKAEMDQTLFDKVFGEGVVKSYDEFKARLMEDFKQVMEQQADKQLEVDMMDYFIKKMKISLPDTFLKKWIRATNDPDKVPDDLIDYEYDEFARRLRWSLIEEKIVKSNNIEIKQEDLVASAKQKIKEQFLLYNQQEIDDTTLEAYSQQLMQDRDQVNRVFEEVRRTKALEFIREKVSIKDKSISYTDFTSLG